jgi:hypothetical protein
MTRATLKFDRLLKLRLIVARFGEMDLAKWWNTRGQLGRLGAAASRRGFPRTHYFAQARSVFAVAAYRCHEIFDPPDWVTLWRLPEAIEEEFDARWEYWLDQANEWKPLLPQTGESPRKRPQDRASRIRCSHKSRIRGIFTTSPIRGRACGALSAPFSGTDHDIALLAFGFACGETGSLAVSYALRGNA